MKPTNELLKRLGISFVASEAGISEYRLNANSLKILLAPDPTSRVVAVVQHVHVGSRHEGAGNTGYSHLLEHMLFKGTPTFNATKGNSYDDFMKRLGGISNATTSCDRTNYFAKLPSAYLGQYLAYEADRLRNAIITDEDLATEMPVVVDEFDIGENGPDEVLNKLLMATMFTEHPYKVETIGAKSEVVKVTAASLKERLYDVYYWPNNTTLVIVGGFDESDALSEVVKHYADIPSSPKPIPPMYTVEPPQFGERRFVINKPGDLARVVLGFHVPGADHEDTYALNALCHILGGNESSRLFRRLVNRGLAAEAYAYANPTHDPGCLQVVAKLTPGTKPQAVERILLREIERIATRLVTKEEMAITQALNLSGTVITNADPLRRAMSISEHEAIATWQWGERFDARFAEVTRDKVLSVAQKYLTAENRTVGYFVPTVRKAKAETPEPTATTADGSKSPTLTTQTAVATEGPNVTSYAAQVKKAVLPNGLTVLLLPTQREAAIGVSFVSSAGSSSAPSGKRIIANLVGELLSDGTAKYSKEKIAKLSAAMLAQFKFRCQPFKTTLNTLVPPSHLPRFVDMLADMVRNPVFADTELELLKKTIAAELEEAATDPGTRAMSALTQSFYGPDSPYFRSSVTEVAKAVAGVTTDDLRAFHSANFVPTGTCLALVGKFDAEKVLKLIESKFGSWQGASASKQRTATELSPDAAARRVNVQIDGKDNLTILVGLPAAVSMTSADYLAAIIANQALGGDTLTSRLGKEIREKRGLTYGVTSRFTDTTLEGAPWLVSMTTNAVKLEQAIPLIGQVVGDFVDRGISESELQMEKDGLVNNFSMSLDTPASVAATIATFEHSGLGVEAIDSYAARVEAVTKEAVDTAARKYFRIGEALTVVAGNLPNKTQES